MQRTLSLTTSLIWQNIDSKCRIHIKKGIIKWTKNFGRARMWCNTRDIVYTGVVLTRLDCIMFPWSSIRVRTTKSAHLRQGGWHLIWMGLLGQLSNPPIWAGHLPLSQGEFDSPFCAWLEGSSLSSSFFTNSNTTVNYPRPTIIECFHCLPCMKLRLGTSLSTFVFHVNFWKVPTNHVMTYDIFFWGAKW